MVDAAGLAEALTSLAAVPPDGDVTQVLHRLPAASLPVLGVAAARLVLDDGRGQAAVLTTAAADDRAAAALAALPVSGPCWECLCTGEAVVASDLALEQRWAQTTGRALEVGLRSVLAVPLRRHGQVLGALGLWHDRPHGWPATEQAVAAALCDVATIRVLQHRRARRSEEVSEQLQRALEARVLVAQVVGVVVRREAVPADEALAAAGGGSRPRPAAGPAGGGARGIGRVVSGQAPAGAHHGCRCGARQWRGGA